MGLIHLRRFVMVGVLSFGILLDPALLFAQEGIETKRFKEESQKVEPQPLHRLRRLRVQQRTSGLRKKAAPKVPSRESVKRYREAIKNVRDPHLDPSELIKHVATVARYAKWIKLSADERDSLCHDLVEILSVQSVRGADEQTQKTRGPIEYSTLRALSSLGASSKANEVITLFEKRLTDMPSDFFYASGILFNHGRMITNIAHSAPMSVRMRLVRVFEGALSGYLAEFYRRRKETGVMEKDDDELQEKEYELRKMPGLVWRFVTMLGRYPANVSVPILFRLRTQIAVEDHDEFDEEVAQSVTRSVRVYREEEDLEAAARIAMTLPNLKNLSKKPKINLDKVKLVGLLGEEGFDPLVSLVREAAFYPKIKLSHFGKIFETLDQIHALSHTPPVVAADSQDRKEIETLYQYWEGFAARVDERGGLWSTLRNRIQSLRLNPDAKRSPQTSEALDRFYDVGMLKFLLAMRVDGSSKERVVGWLRDYASVDWFFHFRTQAKALLSSLLSHHDYEVPRASLDSLAPQKRHLQARNSRFERDRYRYVVSLELLEILDAALEKNEGLYLGELTESLTRGLSPHYGAKDFKPRDLIQWVEKLNPVFEKHFQREPVTKESVDLLESIAESQVGWWEQLETDKIKGKRFRARVAAQQARFEKMMMSYLERLAEFAKQTGSEEFKKDVATVVEEFLPERFYERWKALTN